MKVHLIKKQTIEKFIKSDSKSFASFTIWMNLIKYADWNEPNDIKRTFKSADILGLSSNRVVFNIAGNNYRMICKYYFGKNQVHLFVKWIGNHSDYTKLCNNSMQYDVNNF